MKILVTGGAGFLGSHLCDSLLQKGHEVICVDNLYTGSKKNIEHLMSNNRFEFIRHDITFPLYLEVEGIFNLACPASPIHYQKNPTQTLKTSIHGAINMLGLAKRTGARIFQASTSEVYGDPEIEIQSENYWGRVNPIGIRACYDEGKRAAETLFVDSFREHEVDIRIARIFNTYGPRMALNDGRVVSNFIVNSLQNLDLEVYGEGNQTRSFCFVDDLIIGIEELFFRSDYNFPVNLGNPKPIKMIDLAETIIRLTKSESKIVFASLPSDDPKLRNPDTAKAKELINWNPLTDLTTGLIKTIEYFSKIIP